MGRGTRRMPVSGLGVQALSRAVSAGIVGVMLLAVGIPAHAAGGAFADDDGSVFEADIEWLAETGITRGCNPPVNTLFCPDASVTRGQMATFLVRLAGLEGIEVDTAFSDTGTSEFAASIAMLAAIGVTEGCNPPANDRFCPDDPVTRGQMAAFLTRLLNIPKPDVPVFCDGGGSIDPGQCESWSGNQPRGVFADAADALYRAGIAGGCSEYPLRYCFDDLVTRGQMAAFLHRMIDTPQDTSDFTPPPPAEGPPAGDIPLPPPLEGSRDFNGSGDRSLGLQGLANPGWAVLSPYRAPYRTLSFWLPEVSHYEDAQLWVRPYFWSSADRSAWTLQIGDFHTQAAAAGEVVGGQLPPWSNHKPWYPYRNGTVYVQNVQKTNFQFPDHHFYVAGGYQVWARNFDDGEWVSYGVHFAPHNYVWYQGSPVIFAPLVDTPF